MKKICSSPLAALMTFCAVSFVLMTACTTGGGSGPNDPSDVGDGWPDVVECALDGVVPDIIDTVSRIFRAGTVNESALSDAGRDELEALGKKHGYKSVACVVSKLINDWTSPGATQTPERMGSVQRARHFLDSEDITVIEKGDGPQAIYRPEIRALEWPEVSAQTLDAPLVSMPELLPPSEGIGGEWGDRLVHVYVPAGIAARYFDLEQRAFVMHPSYFDRERERWL
jgi:hypothetical protein